MSKRYTLLLSFVCLLFLLLFGMLCAYSRLATDDYFFISDVRTHGVIEGVRSQYFEWCGRYAATFLMDLIYSVLDTDQTFYFLYPAVSYLLLLSGSYFLLIRSLIKFFDLILKPWIAFLYSIQFTVLLFFLSIDIGETWIWYCGLSSYLWSLIAFIWGCVFVLGRFTMLVSIIGSSFCMIYVGGSSEVFSVIYGVLIMLFLFHRYRQSGSLRSFLNDTLNKRILIPYCVLGIAFIIFLVAPGNYLRDGSFPERNISTALFITLKSIVKFSILYFPFRLVYVIAFAVPFIVLGNMFSQRQIEIKPRFGSFFVRATIIFLSFLLLFFLIVAYVMMETGPPRIWFMAAILFSVYCISICFFAGYCRVINEKKLHALKYAAIILSYIVLGKELYFQSQICPAYAEAHDQRIENLQELKRSGVRDTVICLQPLPSSGMLYSSEIKSDTNHFTNKELRLGYDLNFHVVSSWENEVRKTE